MISGEQSRGRSILTTLYDVFKALLQAREKRGAIDFETVETQMIFDAKGKIEQHRAPSRATTRTALIEECMLAANVCAGGFPRQARAARRCTACTRARRRRSSRRCATSSPRLRPARCPAATSPSRRTTRSSSSAIRDRPDFALLQTVLLRSLKQAVYTPGQRRPLRPRLRGLRALHLADPPLSRTCSCTARSRRVLAGKRYDGVDWDDARPPLLGDRAPRRRRDPRRRELAQVLLHAGPRRRGVRRHHHRRHGLRPVRDAGRLLRRRPGAHLGARARLLPVRRRRATCCSASAPASATGSPTA